MKQLDHIKARQQAAQLPIDINADNNLVVAPALMASADDVQWLVERVESLEIFLAEIATLPGHRVYQILKDADYDSLGLKIEELTWQARQVLDVG